MYTSLQQLLDDVTAAIHETCQGKVFALWGHSLGALLTYEAACLLKSKYDMEPVHVFVSGASAPHVGHFIYNLTLCKVTLNSTENIQKGF